MVIEGFAQKTPIGVTKQALTDSVAKRPSLMPNGQFYPAYNGTTWQLPSFQVPTLPAATLTTKIQAGLVTNGSPTDSLIGFNATTKAYTRVARTALTQDLSPYQTTQGYIDGLRNNDYLKGSASWDGTNFVGSLFNTPFQPMPDGAFYEIYFSGNNGGTTSFNIEIDGAAMPVKSYLDGEMLDVPTDAFLKDGWRKVVIDKFNGYAVVDLGNFTTPSSADNMGNQVGNGTAITNISNGVAATDAATIGQLNLKVNVSDSSAFMFDRDTAKFASGIRNSVSSRFQDSCLSGVTVSRLLGASSSETRNIAFGKTITNPQILLTVKSDITGAQSIILTQVQDTNFTYGMINSVPFDINYQVYYRVCPNFGIGF